MAISRRRFIKGAAGAALLADLALVKEVAAAESEGKAAAARALRGYSLLSDDYSIDPNVTYLNHASIGTIPRVVQAAHQGYLELCETNPWLYMWSEPWREPIDLVRQKSARLLRCHIDEVAILHNTTECFNTLAAGLPIGSGDEVLFCSLNHGGASLCWENQATIRGYSVRRFDFPIAGIEKLSKDEIVARYESQIRPSTQVIALPHIDNTIGLRHPIKEIARMAHERGVRWVVVDGAQSANMIPLDMKDSGVDVYATSAHKWTQSPKGLGLAYFNQAILDVLRPMWVTWGQRSWGDTARKFEDYGTRALPAYMALGDALDYQALTTEQDRLSHHRMMWEAMQSICDQSDHLSWRSTTNWELSAALYAIEIRGQQSSDVALRLFEEHGMVMRAFSSSEINAVRISPNMMNSPSDLQAFADAAKG